MGGLWKPETPNPHVANNAQELTGFPCLVCLVKRERSVRDASSPISATPLQTTGFSDGHDVEKDRKQTKIVTPEK
jgi:hypothetical protein